MVSLIPKEKKLLDIEKLTLLVGTNACWDKCTSIWRSIQVWRQWQTVALLQESKTKVTIFLFCFILKQSARGYLSATLPGTLKEIQLFWQALCTHCRQTWFNGEVLSVDNLYRSNDELCREIDVFKHVNNSAATRLVCPKCNGQRGVGKVVVQRGMPHDRVRDWDQSCKEFVRCTT